MHFLLQVDMRAAITKRAEATLADLRTQLRDKRIRHTGMNRVGNVVEVSFASEEERARANDLLRNTQPDLVLSLPEASAAPYLLRAELSQKAVQNVQSYALKQNISTLHNRINELGVAEPVIAQQGADRIVVQLPRRAGYRPRPRTFSAAPPRLKSVLSTTLLRRSPSLHRAMCPSAMRSSWIARATCFSSSAA